MRRDKKDVKYVSLVGEKFNKTRILLEKLPNGSAQLVNIFDEDKYFLYGDYQTHTVEEGMWMEEPEYVPFDDVSEFKGLWIKNALSGYEEPITFIDIKGNRVKLGHRFYTPEELFTAVEYSLDGHPVGKLKKSEGN